MRFGQEDNSGNALRRELMEFVAHGRQAGIACRGQTKTA
jgi:hypothetical protein